MNIRDTSELSPKGTFFGRLNGGDWEPIGNLVVEEGRRHLLNVALGALAKPSYYIALYEGNVAPADNWAAASFAAAATENISLTEGYTAATRPIWTPGVATAGGAIDNFDSPALFTFASAAAVNINGVALLTNSGRGATTGVLLCAAKYPVTRTFVVGDTFEVGYRLALTT